MKHAAEQTSINFASQNEEIYNSQFSYLEQNLLDKLKDTAPSPDGIKNSLLKNVPDPAKQQLLKIINKCYIETYFPNIWRKSFICSIAKPNRDPLLPTSHRPIPLTTVLCKVMERLINNRLLDFLERIPNFCWNFSCSLYHLLLVPNFAILSSVVQGTAAWRQGFDRGYLGERRASG